MKHKMAKEFGRQKTKIGYGKHHVFYSIRKTGANDLSKLVFLNVLLLTLPGMRNRRRLTHCTWRYVRYAAVRGDCGV